MKSDQFKILTRSDRKYYLKKIKSNKRDIFLFKNMKKTALPLQN